ncbi:hypothetical protein F4778DRAFT_727026 [Xylariomycetidae sp. FL2044]|nr:hypothetical protein F4778DRAFT_727026 [Xylariomycetidae sp. FL2044]
MFISNWFMLVTYPMVVYVVPRVDGQSSPYRLLEVSCASGYSMAATRMSREFSTKPLPHGTATLSIPLPLSDWREQQC